MKRLLAVLAVCASCGGGPIPQGQLNPELIKALCSHYAKCGVVRSESSCESLYANLTLNSYDAQIAAGKIKYDGAKARACLNAYANLACDNSNSAQASADCRAVYVGQVKVGETCGNSAECVPEAYCGDGTGGTVCTGTCKTRVAEGGDATSSSQCAEGLYLSMGKCQAQVGAGGTCSSSSACSDGEDLFCNGGMCSKRGREGAACSALNPCSTLLACANGTCGRLIDLDASCASGSDGGVTSTFSCKLDLYCDSMTRLCKEPLAEGGACSSSSACKDPLVCAQSKCATPVGENQSCAMVTCDSKTYCETGTMICKKRLAVGQPCPQGTSCETNSYCSAGTCTSFTNTCP